MNDEAAPFDDSDSFKIITRQTSSFGKQPFLCALTRFFDVRDRLLNFLQQCSQSVGLLDLFVNVDTGPF